MGGDNHKAVSATPSAAVVLSTATTAAEPEPGDGRARVGASNILRPLFGPFRPGKILAGQVAALPAASVSAWMRAAAESLCTRRLHEGAAPPEAWLERFFKTFSLDAQNRRRKTVALCRAQLDDQLPDAAWAHETLLGELLLAARAHQSRKSTAARVGRAGRQCQPCVYTPPILARRMIETLHVGPKRVVDPACGGGAFLLAAFDRAYARRLETHQPPREAAARVLVDEIAGIDIDRQAVAVAEFSLRLRAWQLAGLDETVPLSLRTADGLAPCADLDGRADIVVGNPPFLEGRGLSREQLKALRKNFRAAARGKVNLFAVFVERGLQMLRDGGVLSFVLPGTLLRNERYRALRELLLDYSLESIERVEPDAFEGQVVETVVLRVRKHPAAQSWRVTTSGGSLLQRNLPIGPSLRFCEYLSPALRRQIREMDRHGVPLGDHFDIRDGISTGFQPFPKRLLGRVDERQRVFTADDGSEHPFDPKKHVPIIDGGEFGSFTPVQWKGRWIEYDKGHEHTPPHPGRPFNCQLRDREIFDRAEKLISRQTAKGVIATIDRHRLFVRNSVHVTYPRAGGPFQDASLAALCAMLSSAFYNRYFLAVTGEVGELFPQVHIADLRRLPILPGLLRKGGDLDMLGEAMLNHRATRGDEAGFRVLRFNVEQLLEDAFGAGEQELSAE